jgi:prepilin-type processing-associated H-X9-DG protein
MVARGIYLPALVYDPETRNVARMKVSQMDPTKSMSTDLLHNINAAAHKDRGVAGINALFGDGHVRFQSARANPAAFDPAIWQNLGSDAFNFRRLMSLWQPRATCFRWLASSPGICLDSPWHPHPCRVPFRL